MVTKANLRVLMNSHYKYLMLRLNLGFFPWVSLMMMKL
jgi:hypothetical protein